MKDNLRFVDSDMHVMEPPDLFERYLDPKFKDRVSGLLSPLKAVPLPSFRAPKACRIGIVCDQYFLDRAHLLPDYIEEGGAPELLVSLSEVLLDPEQFPPKDAPPGFITHIRVEKVGGVGPWA